MIFDFWSYYNHFLYGIIDFKMTTLQKTMNFLVNTPVFFRIEYQNPIVRLDFSTENASNRLVKLVFS